MIPTVGPIPKVRVPRVRDEVLDNGLRLLAVRRSSVPLAEVRLWIPYPATTVGAEARRDLLARTLTAGTVDRSETEIAELLQTLGAALSVSTDADRIKIAGSSLVTGFDGFLELLAEVVASASFPDGPVRAERAAFADEIVLSRSQPDVIAAEAFQKRLFGRHPYAVGLPSPSSVRRVSGASLRSLRTEALVPDGATMVVVGDMAPVAIFRAVERALGGWAGTSSAGLPPAPRVRVGGPITVVHRPGARQVGLRLGGPAARPDDPAYPALDLANLVFGGYFSSRIVRNLREDKGFTYAISSRVDHAAAASTLRIGGEVRPDAAGASLAELLYEMGRLGATSPPADELEEARRFRIGTMTIGAHTQAGLADTVATVVARGLDVRYLRDHPAALEQVTAVDVSAAARRFLAPASMAVLAVGDAADLVPQLEPFGKVDVR